MATPSPLYQNPRRPSRSVPSTPRVVTRPRTFSSLSSVSSISSGPSVATSPTSTRPSSRASTVFSAGSGSGTPRARPLSSLSLASSVSGRHSRRSSILAGVPVVKGNNKNVKLHKLPNELITRIFLLGFHSIEVPGSDQDALDRKREEYVRYLTTMCSLWRNIAIGIHLFWNHATWAYERAAPTAAQLNARMAKMSTFLERAGGLPVDVKLDLARESERTAARVWGEIVKPHFAPDPPSQRTRTSSISSPIRTPIRRSLPAPPSIATAVARIERHCATLWLRVLSPTHLKLILPLPERLSATLTSVDVRIVTGIYGLPIFSKEVGARREIWNSNSPLNGDGVSRLQELAIHSTMAPTLSNFLLLGNTRPGSLTSLTLHARDDSLSPILDFLETCTALTKLNLKITALNFPQNLRMRVTIPTLRTLSITDVPTFEFLQYLAAPKLEELSINKGGWIGVSGWSRGSTAFISHYLRSVKISGFADADPGRVLAILVENPSILSLSINDWATAPFMIVQSLFVSSNARSGMPLLPRLRNLKLEKWVKPGQGGQYLAELLGRREELLIRVDKGSVREDLAERFVSRFGERFEMS
ncbi:hypothetical protein DL93DRAFT_2088514 [Clavulina sp. PMI_390]|nr:hypothetical protein DL93DRAFT_2088514 [Clavulina sp. PMI_390]